MIIMGEPSKPVEILLVEDNPVDVLMTKRALEDGRVCNNLNVVHDGEEAMEFLRQVGRFVNAPEPDLILLDLNLPKKSGREVLSEIKQDPGLLHIPVIVLTSSEAEKDILMSYRLHANCFITKPVNLDQFSAVVRSIEGFWFAVVKLAGRGQP
jgi:two-component system, chemotaxis family, response regulator Rcp1